MIENPIVFISYSWDDEDHKTWVLNLANRLVKDGIDVILDRYHLTPGKNLPYFIQNSLHKSNRVIVVCTPNYKKKAENLQGGVGHEYSLMNYKLLKDLKENKILIPVLRKIGAEGSDESIPVILQPYMYVDFTKDSEFEQRYENLVRDIYKDPEIVKPPLGKRPTFGKRPTTRPIDSTPKPEKELTPEKTPDIIKKVKTLIGKGDLKKALEKMEILAQKKPDAQNNIILLNARFNSLETKKNMGVLTLNEVNVQTNQINFAILSLLDSLT